MISDKFESSVANTINYQNSFIEGEGGDYMPKTQAEK